MMVLASPFEITWHDAGREPQNPPDPRYPDGIDVDGAGSAPHACTATLPYPFRRCGYVRARCRLCGVVVVATTAGRPDDPRSIKIACRNMKEA